MKAEVCMWDEQTSLEAAAHAVKSTEHMDQVENRLRDRRLKCFISHLISKNGEVLSILMLSIVHTDAT